MMNPYRVTSPSSEYTTGDLAWFRRPLKLAAMFLALVVAAPMASAQPKMVAAVVTVKVAPIKTEAARHLDRELVETHIKRGRMFHSWIKKGAK